MRAWTAAAWVVACGAGCVAPTPPQDVPRVDDTDPPVGALGPELTDDQLPVPSRGRVTDEPAWDTAVDRLTDVRADVVDVLARIAAARVQVHAATRDPCDGEAQVWRDGAPFPSLAAAVQQRAPDAVVLLCPGTYAVPPTFSVQERRVVAPVADGQRPTLVADTTLRRVGRGTHLTLVDLELVAPEDDALVVVDIDARLDLWRVGMTPGASGLVVAYYARSVTVVGSTAHLGFGPILQGDAHDVVLWGNAWDKDTVSRSVLVDVTADGAEGVSPAYETPPSFVSARNVFQGAVTREGIVTWRTFRELGTFVSVDDTWLRNRIAGGDPQVRLTGAIRAAFVGDAVLRNETVGATWLRFDASRDAIDQGSHLVVQNAHVEANVTRGPVVSLTGPAAGLVAADVRGGRFVSNLTSGPIVAPSRSSWTVNVSDTDVGEGRTRNAAAFVPRCVPLAGRVDLVWTRRGCDVTRGAVPDGAVDTDDDTAAAP
ncbi:MAG: hypothetical protein H6733_10940 [Alphaproteobacteria bacterium]|nr:hypothetical protein [Alphaproteobacteria bacterium]